MKRKLFVLALCTLCFMKLHSQSLMSMDTEGTLNYIFNLLDQNRFASYGMLTINLEDNKNIKEDGQFTFRIKPSKKSFLIKDVNINKIITRSGSSPTFSISCKKGDCIRSGRNLEKNISIFCSSEDNLVRLRNSLLHLQHLIFNSNIIYDEFDPFLNFEENIIFQLSISNITFWDNNKNNRIDNEENNSLIITLSNYGSKPTPPMTMYIKELHNISGIIFKNKHSIPSILSNQSINIEIPITSNVNLEIGVANFEAIIESDGKIVTSKRIKIATFNSGPSEVIISSLPDVDINIPTSNQVRRNTYAIVIGNEDYKSKHPSLSYESNVKYATNDAKIFKEYLIRTIGVPTKNITYLIDATATEIKQAISKVKQLPLINPDAELIFYYAGHGLPEEKTKGQYLIPVDVNGSNISFGIKLDDIISELTSNNPKRVLFLIDACFSGAARDESLLSNRAVRVRPKSSVLKGNTIVLSSSSNVEASKAYEEMQHGMFTYFLLKKIQETKGKTDFQSLFDFLHFNVREKSLLLNNQIQTPTIEKSSEISVNFNEIAF